LDKRGCGHGQERAFSPQELTVLGRKAQYDHLNDPPEAHEDRVIAWYTESVTEIEAPFDYAKLDADARDHNARLAQIGPRVLIVRNDTGQ
jgi:hypothetical protein